MLPDQGLAVDNARNINHQEIKHRLIHNNY